jgi:hypothetical protein
MNREAIAAALFAKLQGVTTFATASRRLKSWADVAAADQPALFLNLRTYLYTQRPGLGPVWEFNFDAYVYVKTDDNGDVAPSTVMNPILDAIDAVLQPDNAITNKQTLGGLVQHCWIEGRVDTDEGVLGGQGVAIIPIVVKVA